ncbi:hypothetical protein GPALN_003119 [Globodera pallida]|nr:hypothetical protein GPALN_003119 [Globodera pallida]
MFPRISTSVLNSMTGIKWTHLEMITIIAPENRANFFELLSVLNSMTGIKWTHLEMITIIAPENRANFFELLSVLNSMMGIKWTHLEMITIIAPENRANIRAQLDDGNQMDAIGDDNYYCPRKPSKRFELLSVLNSMMGIKWTHLEMITIIAPENRANVLSSCLTSVCERSVLNSMMGIKWTQLEMITIIAPENRANIRAQLDDGNQMDAIGDDNYYWPRKPSKRFELLSVLNSMMGIKWTHLEMITIIAPENRANIRAQLDDGNQMDAIGDDNYYCPRKPSKRFELLSVLNSMMGIKWTQLEMITIIGPENRANVLSSCLTSVC